MKWIPASEPPKKDTLCFIVCRRSDGSLYTPWYAGYYTIGIQRTPNSGIYVGFMQPSVVAWMPIPEPYTKNRMGWIQTAEKWPTKKGEYIVSTFKNGNIEHVKFANFNPDREEFYGQPDVIAWMPVPKIKLS
jgi:hypothetical protein